MRSNHFGVQTQVANVTARKQALASAESALEATQIGYEVGTRNTVDLLDAQKRLFQAQRDYFGAHTFERVDGKRGEFFHNDWIQDTD